MTVVKNKSIVGGKSTAQAGIIRAGNLQIPSGNSSFSCLLVMVSPVCAPIVDGLLPETGDLSWVASIARSSFWEARVSPEGRPELPDVGFVEPMLRRRLSPMARMVLRVAYDCAAEVPGVRVVFASRHGELVRTTTMLESLAMGEELSPTLFSMSVLNASVGLFSILLKNTAPATAISAGRASFGYGLLEACMQRQMNPSQPVLFVYADEPVPEVYGHVDTPDARAHALGLLLTEPREFRVSFSMSASNGSHVSSSETQSSAFMRCLEGGRDYWRDADQVWTWQREA